MKPLSESCVAAVTTSGFSRADDPPFDASIRGGDCSYRVIPAETDLRTLRISHTSDAFDARGVKSDPNLALPLDRFHTLSAAGMIGSIAPRHFSFMGSITAPGRLINKTAPEVARLLIQDQVDAVLLTPV